MDTPSPRTNPFEGLFEFRATPAGLPQLARAQRAAKAIPDPATGRLLKVASVEVSDRTVCPACAQLGAGGYVSFVSDLRLAFACPACRSLVWLPGA